MSSVEIKSDEQPENLGWVKELAGAFIIATVVVIVIVVIMLLLKGKEHSSFWGGRWGRTWSPYRRWKLFGYPWRRIPPYDWYYDSNYY